MRAIYRPTKMSANEVAAVRRARKGDRKALEAIIQLAEPFVYYNCLKFTGRDHEADAQDLMQETLIKVCSRLNTLEKNERFLSWVLSITINTCKDFYKKKRDYELFSDTDDQSAQELYEAIPDEDLKSQTVPEKKVDNEETQKMIRDIIDELPDEQRIAVTLTYYDFLTSRQIAEQLNVNENTVKYRLASARRKIQRRIEDYKAEGIKLYNVAPASFLSYLSYFLSNEAKEMSGVILSELPVASLMAALSEAGVTIGMITGSTAGTFVSAVGAALSGIGVFLSATGGKIVAIIVVSALVVGATESAASLNKLLFQAKPDRVEVEKNTISDKSSSVNYEETHESSTDESETSAGNQSSTSENQSGSENSATNQTSENQEASGVLRTEGSGNTITDAAGSSENNGTGSSATSTTTASSEESSSTNSESSGESSETSAEESSSADSVDNNDGYSFTAEPGYLRYYKGSGDLSFSLDFPPGALTGVTCYNQSTGEFFDTPASAYSYNGSDQLTISGAYLDSLGYGTITVNLLYTSEDGDGIAAVYPTIPDPSVYRELERHFILTGEIVKADGTTLTFPEERYVWTERYDWTETLVNEEQFNSQYSQMNDPVQRLLNWAAECGYDLGAAYVQREDVAIEEETLHYYNSSNIEISASNYNPANGDYIIRYSLQEWYYHLSYNEENVAYSYDISPEYNYYTKGTGGGVTLTMDAPENALTRITIANVDDFYNYTMLSSDAYSYNGSTQVVIASAYLDALPVGDYVFTISYTDDFRDIYIFIRE